MPDPAELMTDDFRESLDHLIDEQADQVDQVIAEQEDLFFREHLTTRTWSDAQELDFVGMTPPPGLLGIPVASTSELRACLLAVDHRWRLDAIVALDDYLS